MKERGEQQKGRSKKNQRNNKREKVRKIFTYIYHLKPLFLYIENTVSMHIKP